MLNERLRNLRLAKGFTLKQVGDVFGISKTSVSSWESGVNQPDPRKLEKLATLFDTSVEFLVTGQSYVASEKSSLDQSSPVPYIPWELLTSPPALNLADSQVVSLYIKPTENTFATRFLGSSNLDWQQGPIPAGAIVIVESGKLISHGCHVLAIKNNQEIVIGQILNSDAPGTYIIRYLNSKTSSRVDTAIKIIGVILEWRISAKL